MPAGLFNSTDEDLFGAINLNTVEGALRYAGLSDEQRNRFNQLRVRNSPQGQLGAIAQGQGFTPEQLNTLIQALNQSLGASNEQQIGILKQNLAGAPRAVRQGALQSQQNRLLGAQTRGETSIRASGADRQLRALMALLQADLQQKQIDAQKSQGLLDSFASLAGPFGEALADKVFPKEE